MPGMVIRVIQIAEAPESKQLVELQQYKPHIEFYAVRYSRQAVRGAM
eukprot:COSAG02_NODE_17620_length_991_cov_1.019058_2_plen_47_part_00